MSKDTKEETGTELANVSPQAMQLIEQLDIKLSDPDMMTVLIAQRLALAETPESLDAIADETSVENYLGEPFNIRRVHYLPATYGQSLPVYAVVECAHAGTGEFTVWSTGATGVVIALARAVQKGWLDRPWKVLRADTPTASGYYPLRLVQA